ncbi:MAG: hypothetical protein E6G92_02275 [Alphaproteobacteria bacterium]|nr:MAG: hypothetical protein E6G92_02275 [Alphaproteobacteria bacterium]
MIVIEEPPAPAAALAEVKAYLRIGHDGEDALLAGLIGAAGEACEAFTRRALMVRELIETLPGTGAWTRLGAAPVMAITAVAAGDVPLAPGDYAVDIDSAGEGWVRLLRPIEAGRVSVAYRAGMAADPGRLPEALRHGIVRLAAHLYTIRDGGGPREPPAAVTALWRPWRRLRLG